MNLEKNISDWRRQMLAAGIKAPVPLEELESHLREEIERQMKSGLDWQTAFEISIRHFGQPKELHGEFKKSERTFMKRTLVVLCGILGVLVGAAFILPALHLYNEQGMVHNAAVGFLLGVPIVLAGVGAAAFGFKRRKA
jgi:hypothetical protein